MLQNYISRLTAGETFELQTNTASVHIQDLAEKLFSFEVALVNNPMSVFTIIDLVKPVNRYDVHMYDFQTTEVNSEMLFNGLSNNLNQTVD